MHHVTPDPAPRRSPARDDSMPALLLTALVAVMAAVAGVVLIGETAAGIVVLGAIVVLLLATAFVTARIVRQLDDQDGGPGD
jgi:hypothetical protein